MKEEDECEQRDCWSKLESHWKPPACGRVDIHVLIDPEIYPKSHKTAGLIREFEETSKDTPNRGDRQLCDIGWHSGSDGATTNTGESSSSVYDCVSIRRNSECVQLTDVGQFTWGCSHEHRTDDEDNDIDLKGPFSAPFLGEEVADDGAKERACLEG